MRLHPSPESVDQHKIHARKNGRPKTWTGTLLRKLVVLDVFSNFTNDQLLQTLRGSTEGTRSLQTQRKRLLGPGCTRWRSRDVSQMHRRISHLQSQLKLRAGPRILSLDPVMPRGFQNPTEISLASSTSSHLLHDHHSCRERLNFRMVKDTESQTDRSRVQIRMSTDNANGSVEICREDNTTETLSRLLQSSSPRRIGDKVASLSIILSYVNLTKNPWFEQDNFCDLLRDRVTMLEMNNCKLAVVPQNLRLFSRLKYLNLSRNRLTKVLTAHLPESLTHLNLRHNRIDKLPEELLKFNSLRMVAVSHNLITELPSWLSAWDSLQVLYAEGNPLNSLHYSSWHNAFQSCMGPTDKPCKNCVRLATKNLKERLSLSFDDHAAATNETSCKDCGKDFRFSNRGSTLTSTEPLRHSGSGLSRLSKDVDCLSLLKSFSQRMSILSGSFRSSVSGLTLDSISSAGVDSVPRLDMLALRLVHCCERTYDDPRTRCIHFLISSWISSGATVALPSTTLSELDLEGNSALHIAATFGACPEVLKYCIEVGCEPSIVNSHGQTFLHRVAVENWDFSDMRVVGLLLYLSTKGFDFGHPDYRGNTIFHQSEKWILAFRKLYRLPDIPGYDPLRKNASGKLALEVNPSSIETKPWTRRWIWSRCCSHSPSKPESIIRLSFRDVDPLLGGPVLQAQCEKTSCKPDFLATHLNPLHAFACLMSLGYRRFHVNIEDETWDSAKALERVLETDAEVNDYNEAGETTLMIFIRTLGRCQRRLEDVQIEQCINLLIAKKANVRWYSRSGETALHYAIYYGLPHAIEPLVKAGANTNARNSRGLSVLELLVETMHKMKSNVTLFASFQQCMAVLADYGAVLQPSLEKELQWQVGTVAS